MKWGICIISMGDREQGMMKVLDSIGEVHPSIGVTAVLQGYPLDSPVHNHSQIEKVLAFPDALGPHSARVIGLSRMLDEGYEVIVNMDDDMELVPETDLRPSVLRSRVRGIGLVSNAWRRSPKNIAKATLERKFISQPIVETGGGLAYSASTAEVILRGSDKDYLYDDSEWSLRTYLAGLVNQRYLGSVAVHKSMSAGGRLSWVYKKKRALCDERYLTPRPRLRPGLTVKRRDGEGNTYRIYLTSDLTPMAHQLHKENRANIQ